MFNSWSYAIREPHDINFYNNLKQPAIKPVSAVETVKMTPNYPPRSPEFLSYSPLLTKTQPHPARPQPYPARPQTHPARSQPYRVSTFTYQTNAQKADRYKNEYPIVPKLFNKLA